MRCPTGCRLRPFVFAFLLICLALSAGVSASLAQTVNNSAQIHNINPTPTAALAPNAAEYPFLRFVAVLLSGFAISAARLAQRFRRFWGLGVFTNWYAVLFVAFGTGACGIPIISGNALSSIPHVGSRGPWIADFSGIALALLLPVVGIKSKKKTSGEQPVRDLDYASSSNPILGLIEGGISNRIQDRMQSELIVASRQYSWETIRLAGSQALEEEMTIRPLGNDEYERALKSIEGFRPESDRIHDVRSRYGALLHLLRWCSYDRLLRALVLAERETQI